MPDSEVGNAFVTIGGKTEALKTAFRDSEALTRNTLGRMGREIGGFAAKFGGKIGLGLGGGFAGAAALIVKSGIEVSGSLANVAQRSGELGVSFETQIGIIDQFLARSAKVTPMTREQSLAMGALGLQYGFAGSKLERLLRASTGLAEGFGQPVEAMQALIDVLTKGGDLLPFGVKATGTTEQLFFAGEQVGLRREAAQQRRGQLRPGDFLKGISAAFERAGAQLSEDFFRGADRTPLTDAQRRREAEIRKIEVPLTLPGIGTEGLFKSGFIPPGKVLPPAVPQPPASRFSREAEFFNDRATGETGVGASERALRGTRAGGGGGTESEELSSALEKLKGAVDNNTAAVKGLSSSRPLVAEHP